MAAADGPTHVAHGVQHGSEPQQRANGDAAASRSLAGQHLMAALQQRLAASSDIPMNLADALQYREDDESDKQAADRAAEDPFIVARLEELFDDDIFSYAEAAGQRSSRAVPAAAMIMRKLYAIGDQAERDAAERYSPEAEAANESIPTAAAGAMPQAGDNHPSAGAAALPEDVYSLASSEQGAISAVDLAGSGDSGPPREGGGAVAVGADDGQPMDTAAQSGGSSGTGAGELQGPPATDALLSVAVICNGLRGLFHITKQVMECRCRSCQAKAERDGSMVTMTPTEYERHAGMAASKKWKYTVRVDDGSEDPQPVGAWLEARGLVRTSERTIAAKRGGLDGAGPPKAPPLPTRPPSSRSANSQYRRGADGKFVPGQGRPAPPVRGLAGLRRHVSLTAAHRGNGSGSDLGAGDDRGEDPNGGSCTPRLRAPSKRWLEASSAQVLHHQHEEDESEEDVVELREGAEHQAAVPPLQQAKPAGACTDPRAGVPGPSLEEALLSAAGKERAVAEALPPDAIQDVIARGPRDRDLEAPLERGARVKRRPHWLNNTVDPALAAQNRVTLTNETESSLGGSAPAHALGGGMDDAQSRLTESGGRGWGGRPRRTDSDMAAHWAPVKSEDRDEAPHVVSWRLTHYGVLEATLTVGGRTFRGELAPLGRTKRPAEASPPDKPPKRLGRPPKQPSSAPPLPPLMSASPSQLPSVMAVPHPTHPDAVTAAAAAAATTAGLRRAASAAAATLGTKEEVNAERRAASDREYMRMAQDGAPPDAKCTLCDMGASGAAETLSDEFGARAEGGGLGPWLLVRVSAITNAWIHEQCARWSPEVYETDDGLQMVPEAVRRGRKIKCRECGGKGATLGCLNRFCRSSFHLSCARNCGCELQGAPYKVMCPQHRGKGTGYIPVRGEAQLPPPLTPTAPPPQPPHHHQHALQQPPAHLLPQPQHKPQLLHQHQHQAQQQVTPSPSPMARADDLGSSDLGGYFRSPQPPRASPQPRAPPPEPDDARPRDGSSEATLEEGPAPGDGADIRLGGTVGQCRWRPGRCAVCVVQRKGKCGTISAPRSCLRRKAHGTAPLHPPPGPSLQATLAHPRQPPPQPAAAPRPPQHYVSLPPPLQPPTLQPSGPALNSPPRPTYTRPGPANSSLGSLQQQLAAAAKAPSANAPGFAQTLPTMSSGPFQAALPLTSQVGPTLPQRQAQAQSSPRRFQLPQLRPPPQYTQLPQQAAFWPLPQQQQPQQQQPPQQQATQPRLPQQPQWQIPALPASQQQQQQAGFGGGPPQDGAGSVSQNGGGSTRQTQAYVHPADTDGRSYLGPVLPPIAKKKRT